jgi:hypothetical protein
VTSSVDLSPPRRPIFFPVVIATVFLTIIGMAGGYVLGERHRQNARAAQQPSQQQTAPVISSSPASGPNGTSCPDQAAQTAAELHLPSELSQVLKIYTDNGTTVWICQDPGGALYYQSKTGGADAPLVQGQNGLFLNKVKKTGTDQYEAVAHNGNLFEVSRQQLQVRFVDGRKPQTNPVVSAE